MIFLKKFFKKKLKPDKLKEAHLLPHIDYYALTNVGNNRENNEDFTAAGCNKFGNKILFVCDGLGGYFGGKEASKIVGETIIEDFLEQNFNEKTEKEIHEWFVKTINEARFKISKVVFENYKFSKMASTLAMFLIFKDQVYGFNIGDSRLYGLKNNQIYQISKDQNFLNYLLEQNIDDQAISDYGDQIYAIINYIGFFDESELKYDFFKFNLNDYKLLLVTSDGVHNFIDSEAILKKVVKNPKIIDLCEEIINEALLNDSNDNLSIAVGKLQ